MCKATAIPVAVVVPSPKANRHSDAIGTCLDHKNGNSTEVSFRYKSVADTIVYEEIVPHAGKNEHFYGQ